MYYKIGDVWLKDIHLAGLDQQQDEELAFYLTMKPAHEDGDAEDIGCVEISLVPWLKSDDIEREKDYTIEVPAVIFLAEEEASQITLKLSDLVTPGDEEPEELKTIEEKVFWAFLDNSFLELEIKMEENGPHSRKCDEARIVFSLKVGDKLQCDIITPKKDLKKMLGVDFQFDPKEEE